MTVWEMQEQLAKVYPTAKWRAKLALMSDEQIMAVYLKFRDEGKLDKPERYFVGRGKVSRVESGSRVKPRGHTVKAKDETLQITIDDLMKTCYR